MLTSISPIDGRYRKTTDPLAQFFSEQALISYRIFVECEYLIALSELGLPELRKFTDDEKALLKGLKDISANNAQIVSDIETKGYKDIPATNHDVKAVEYFMKMKLANTSLKDVLEWIHFALTSYDTNTPARGLMLSDTLEQVIFPAVNEINFSLTALAGKYKNLPMLARTHGQPASPTTFGKEISVFQHRLNRQLEQLKSVKISVKLSGATGNFNAHIAAYPKIDWLKFSSNFIQSFNVNRKIKLEPNLHATQIDSHDSEAEIFDNLRRINTILIGFNQDIWRYISDGWLKQKKVEGEVGSSTMPHKVNPINFENSEGNLGMANALLNHFAMKLPISRLQRDLSDSTVERNFGVALGHCLIAYKYIIKGLARVAPDEQKMLADLQACPEVVTEAIQTILRREGVAMPYEQMKELTRGKTLTLQDFATFIDSLSVSPEIKQQLKHITPENYTGLAEKLTEM